MTWYLWALLIFPGLPIVMLGCAGLCLLAFFFVDVRVQRRRLPEPCCGGCGTLGTWPRGPSGYPRCERCAVMLASDPRE